MAKQQSSETFKLPLGSKARQGRGALGLEVLSRVESETWVLILVSVVTAYLVLPPLYSVIQTSLFTTKLTGNWISLPSATIRTCFASCRYSGRF